MFLTSDSPTGTSMTDRDALALTKLSFKRLNVGILQRYPSPSLTAHPRGTGLASTDCLPLAGTGERFVDKLIRSKPALYLE
jgi:hypothetical protein